MNFFVIKSVGKPIYRSYQEDNARDQATEKLING